MLAWLLARRQPPLAHVQTYGLAFIPLILSLHAAKLVKAFDEVAGYLPRALADPRGFATAAAIDTGSLAAPGPLVPGGVAAWGWLMLAFVAGFGLLGSLYVVWRIARVSFADAPGEGVRSAIPFAVALVALGAMAILTIYTWLISGAGG